jgi:predicted dehydrogenase
MDKNWKALSVLIVGCGSIAKRHARVLTSLQVEDIRACDPNAKARQNMREQTPNVKLFDSYEQGLKEYPDTVFICTPPQLHIPMAMLALEHHCHVLIEKPLSDSTQGIDALKKAAQEKNKKVMVALCFRYHEGMVKAKQYLKEGGLGRLIFIRTVMGEHLPEIRPDYDQLAITRTIGVFDLIHDLDLGLWFAQLPVKSVKSLYGTYSDINIEAPDLAELLIDFDGPCALSVHLDYFQRPRKRYIELICTEGLITIESAAWDHYTVSVYNAKQKSWRHETCPTTRDDMFRAEDSEFLQAVADDLPIVCNIDEGFRSIEVLSQISCFK